MNDKILNILVVLSTILAILVLFNYAYGEDVVIYRTYPGSHTPNKLASALIIKDNKVYQTYPGTHTPNTLAPALVIRKDGSYGHGRFSGFGRQQYQTNIPMQQSQPNAWSPYGAKTP